MKIDRLQQALQEGHPVRDEDFDAIYPFAYQQVSARFWTPVETARRATDLLVSNGSRRILDVGSGVGKFCLVGAAATTRACFFGIEQRAHLVQAACAAKQCLGIERVEFRHGRLEDVNTEEFDAFYFYNPFTENLMGRSNRLDDYVHLSRTRYRADVRKATSVLAAAAPGTRVVTYFGYGGTMPPEYDLVHAERPQWGTLQLWIKNPKALAHRKPNAISAERSGPCLDEQPESLRQ